MDIKCPLQPPCAHAWLHPWSSKDSEKYDQEEAQLNQMKPKTCRAAWDKAQQIWWTMWFLHVSSYQSPDEADESPGSIPSSPDRCSGDAGCFHPALMSNRESQGPKGPLKGPCQERCACFVFVLLVGSRNCCHVFFFVYPSQTRYCHNIS